MKEHKTKVNFLSTSIMILFWPNNSFSSAKDIDDNHFTKSFILLICFGIQKFMPKAIIYTT